MKYIVSYIKAAKVVERPGIDDIRTALTPSFPIYQYCGWSFGLLRNTVTDRSKDFLKRHLPFSLKWTNKEKS
jgi:hypothetical protein